MVTVKENMHFIIPQHTLSPLPEPTSHCTMNKMINYIYFFLFLSASLCLIVLSSPLSAPHSCLQEALWVEKKINDYTQTEHFVSWLTNTPEDCLCSETFYLQETKHRNKQPYFHHLYIGAIIIHKRVESKGYRGHFYKTIDTIDGHLNSGTDVFPSGFTEGDSSLFHCRPKWLNSVGAVRPGNSPVHHPGDASLLASVCQHLTHSLTRCHAACGSQLLLQCPLLGWTGKHRDRRAAGEHVCRYVVLGARKLQPVVELPVRPDGLPAPVLHSQSHLLQVPGVSVHKGRVHGFIFICAGLRLGGCLSLTHTPSCLVCRHKWTASLNLT